tara:strand:- start:1054 stop:1440 length:387 start_codon:yes stop_codon:yes gene_type:complete
LIDKFFFIALGAAFGGYIRVYLSKLIGNNIKSKENIVIYLNILTCFLAGLIFSLEKDQSIYIFSRRINDFLVVGLLGCVSTYSGFAKEIIKIFFDKEWLKLIIFIFKSIFGCLFVIGISYYLVSTFIN